MAAAPSKKPQPPARKKRENAKVIYLTFDDGPSLQYTPQVLHLLDQYHATAVFCEIGIEVRAHPEMTRKVVSAGHTLCDHTLSHDLYLPQRSSGRIRSEVHSGLTSLYNAAPHAPVPFFRAPGGAWSDRIRAAARRDKMSCLTWTVDPRDWSRPGVRKIVSVVRQNVRPGATVLFHDGGGDRSQTLAALRQLLPSLAKEGYRFEVPPADMFRCSR